MSNERQMARLEQFSISKKDADYIRSCSYAVTEKRDYEIIAALVNAGASIQDVIDIYQENSIGKMSERFKRENFTYIEKAVMSLTVSLTDSIEEILTKNGFSFGRNLMSDEISVIIPGYDRPMVYDDFVIAEIHKIAINSKIGNRSDFEDVVRSMANKNAFHPMKDYFENLVWDGKDYIHKLSTYIRDAHEPITYTDGSKRTVIHAYLLRFFVGVIKRIYDNDTSNAMLILHGKQGDGKSTFAQWLSPKKDWLIESDLDPKDKDHIRALREKMVWEVAELDATFRKADISALKNLLTKRNVTIRNPYDRMQTTKPVMTSFIGTINPGEDGFLNDPSGYRRFNVVELESIDWAYATEINIDDCWAQAFALFKNGETGRLHDCEVEVQKLINSVHEEENLVAGALEQIMELIDKDVNTTPIKAAEIARVMQQYCGFEKETIQKLIRQINKTLISTRYNFSKSKNTRTIHNQNYWVGLKFKADYDVSAEVYGKLTVVEKEGAF